MYSKAENQRLKQEFWVAFAQKYPRKWMLYDTKIKDLSLKFFVDNTKAQVSLEIEVKPNEKRWAYFEQLEALKTILIEEYLPEVVFQRDFSLENGKTISRIWVELHPIAIGNRNNWETIFDFFYAKMNALELFFIEYEDVIKTIEF
ncbi:MAG: DUF4268 domain-containing protein [Flavobacterium sp.]|nr:DUF4268 domain-containing protein [Flavobacterium sp.]